MDFSFRHTYEVRYDECNLFGWLTPVAVLRYMQDIAALHATKANILEGGNWVARRTVVEFAQTEIPARTLLGFETYPLGFTKVTAQRAYDIHILSSDGWPDSPLAEPVVRARTLWVYLDQRGRPARIPASFYDFWEPGTPSPPMYQEADWPIFPDQPAFKSSRTVLFSDLDIMGHMNNAAYVELLDNLAWQALTKTGIRPDREQGYPSALYYDIEYQESAQAGDLLEVSCWFKPGETPGEFARLEKVTRDGKAVLRSHSRWRWQGQVPDLWRLYNL